MKKKYRIVNAEEGWFVAQIKRWYGWVELSGTLSSTSDACEQRLRDLHINKVVKVIEVN